MKYNILIVEDEIRMREFVSVYFRAEGYTVYEANDGEEALDIFKKKTIDLIVLDIMIDKLDGKEVCRIIRENSEVPIIMLTALEGEDDQLKCYEFGADDYITKPFVAKILIAKANRLLKRANIASSDIYKHKELKINFEAREVFIKGKLIEFAPKEFNLLRYLVLNKGIALTREQILNEVWGFDYYGDTRVVDNHILKIRNKLNDLSKCLKTVITVGYKYEEI